MNIIKSVGIVTGAIPIVGILIGGITFGINFKTDVESIKESVVKQEKVNVTVEERFSSIPREYDDTDLWDELNNIWIPEEYDDSHLSEKIQQLDVDIVELRTRLENLDFNNDSYDDSDLRGRIAELSGSLNALSNVTMDSNGDVDMSAFVIQIGSIEGSIQSFRNTLNSLDSKINSNKNEVRTVQNQVNSLERNSSSRSVQNYDDTSLKNSVRTLTSSISDIERRLSNVGGSSGSSSTTRVENPYDDTSIRNDIKNLRSDIQALQRDRGITYDDTSLRSSISTLQNNINTLQSQLNSISNQSSHDPRVDTLLNDLQNIKNDVENRIQDIEYALTNINTDSTSDHRFNEFEDQLMEEFHWTMEEFYFEIEDLRNQVYSLQETVNFLDSNVTSDNNNNTTSSDIGGGANANPHLYVTHNENSYTGDYWLDGEYNGHPLWVNWDCGNPGSQFEYCYIFRYPVGFTNSGWVWVIQPIPPSTEWSANSYVDARWPWKKEWDGDVQNVEAIQ